VKSSRSAVSIINFRFGFKLLEEGLRFGPENVRLARAHELRLALLGFEQGVAQFPVQRSDLQNSPDVGRYRIRWGAPGVEVVHDNDLHTSCPSSDKPGHTGAETLRSCSIAVTTAAAHNQPGGHHLNDVDHRPHRQ
jgi:hypothetical protein